MIGWHCTCVVIKNNLEDSRVSLWEAQKAQTQEKSAQIIYKVLRALKWTNRGKMSCLTSLLGRDKMEFAKILVLFGFLQVIRIQYLRN